MRRFSPDEAESFRALLESAGWSPPAHQISAAYTDGITGYAISGTTGAAVVVGDVVELMGEADDEIVAEIAAFREAHVMDPPESWAAVLTGAPNLPVTPYERVAFHPLLPDDARRCAHSRSAEGARTAGAVPGRAPFRISPIDDDTVAELMAHPWSADLVANTMAPPNAHLGGFGFVARIDTNADGAPPARHTIVADRAVARGAAGPSRCVVVGGIGCYTVYRRGVEIEIDTHRDYRRRGIATALTHTMIAECARRDLEIHWDAMNSVSAELARNVGFREMRQYRCLGLRM